MASSSSLNSSTGRHVNTSLREMKKKSKKSKTLPSRIKFLNGISGSTGNIPTSCSNNSTTIQGVHGERIILTKSTLSIFKDKSDLWRGGGYEIDESSLGSLIEYGYPTPAIMSLSCNNYPGHDGRNSPLQNETSKSLTRAEGNRASKFLKSLSPLRKRTQGNGDGSPSCQSPLPQAISRSQSRTNSRLKLNPSTLTQCFGISGEVNDLNTEDSYLPRSQACNSHTRKETLLSPTIPSKDLDFDHFYPSDTSYDKACGSDRRNSIPLTQIAGQQSVPPSRIGNFFSKRSFKSNPLKRAKSVSKLEKMESDSSPSYLHNSRSHESLLSSNDDSFQSIITNDVMSSMEFETGHVIICPLHPSIMGDKYGFQMSTPTVPHKYYYCSSLQERDAWIQILQRKVKPFANQVLRHENSFKIWIQEAKGLPNGKQLSSNKRYYCEIYFDQTLYGKTSLKPKKDMLFWGENFNFDQIPIGTQVITIILYLADDKKRKDKTIIIGEVKIFIAMLNSRQVVEKWYKVEPAEASCAAWKVKNSKDGGPSIRIKCRYQSMNILPLKCYESFLQYVKEDYGAIVECLESLLSVKAKEDVANALVQIMHHEDLANEFIAELGLQDTLKCGDEKLTFRGNSIATKAMESFLKLIGLDYVRDTLKTFIESVQNSEDSLDFEIDPTRLSSDASLTKNRQSLLSAVDHVWKIIQNSHKNFPRELRCCFAKCRDTLKSVGKNELGEHLISASIFLRLVCPAILAPSLFNITKEYPTEKFARNLTLVTKVVQTLANFTRFQGKETYMEFLNDYLEKEEMNMKNFLLLISTPLDKLQSGGIPSSPKEDFIDIGKQLSILATLFTEYVEKLVQKNSSFARLEKITYWIQETLKSYSASNNLPSESAGLAGIAESYKNILPSLQTSAFIPRIRKISPPKSEAVTDLENSEDDLSLQLQLPKTSSFHSVDLSVKKQRSGSQASSGYQSRSPLLESENFQNSTSVGLKREVGNSSKSIENQWERKLSTLPLSFSNPGFKSLKSDIMSQTIEDGNFHRKGFTVLREGDWEMLASSDDELNAKITRSYGCPENPRRSKCRVINPKPNPTSNRQRVYTRRTKADLIRKSYAYSSSTDDYDSDSGLISLVDRKPTFTKLPHDRNYQSTLGEKSAYNCHSNGRNMRTEDNGPEYEREMAELRRAMEELQVKLNLAEQRLFGCEVSPNDSKKIPKSAGNSAKLKERGHGGLESNQNSTLNGKTMDLILEKFYHAEEEMKREQKLLQTLDRKDKLIEAQQEKISRLGAVNSQLMGALSHIRNSTPLGGLSEVPSYRFTISSYPISKNVTFPTYNLEAPPAIISPVGNGVGSHLSLGRNVEMQRKYSTDCGVMSFSISGNKKLLKLTEVKSSSC